MSKTNTYIELNGDVPEFSITEAEYFPGNQLDLIIGDEHTVSLVFDSVDDCIAFCRTHNIDNPFDGGDDE